MGDCSSVHTDAVGCYTSLSHFAVQFKSASSCCTYLILIIDASRIAGPPMCACKLKVSLKLKG